MVWNLNRHDRDADLARFARDPYHGFFVNTNKKNLAYTIMAAGDDIVLEDGTTDGGLGRLFLFSSPRTCGNGIKLGDKDHDNSREITTSRDHILRYLGITC